MDIKRPTLETIGRGIAGAGLATIAFMGCSAENGTPAESTTTTTAAVTDMALYPVDEVVDGDTVKLDTDYNPDTKSETFRLIGINTPETRDPRQPVQCYGHEASEFAKARLKGQEVGVEQDPSQDTHDRYGRSLGYIILADGTNFNQLMVAEGYAWEYTYETPYRYQAEFQAAEDHARQNDLGLWDPEACGGEEKPAE